MSTHEITEPFFITDEIQAELIAAGYVFEPPTHFTTVHMYEKLFAPPRDQPNNVIPIFGQVGRTRPPQDESDK